MLRIHTSPQQGHKSQFQNPLSPSRPTPLPAISSFAANGSLRRPGRPLRQVLLRPGPPLRRAPPAGTLLASLPQPHPTSAQGLAPRLTRFTSQAASKGATTDEWPYSVHLLAHLYINDLYAIRRPCPRFFPFLFWVWG